MTQQYPAILQRHKLKPINSITIILIPYDNINNHYVINMVSRDKNSIFRYIYFNNTSLI